LDKDVTGVIVNKIEVMGSNCCARATAMFVQNRKEVEKMSRVDWQQ